MLREDGWVCSRSAMSHGPVDIFAAKNQKVLLIQVKSGQGRMLRAKAAEFVDWAKAFSATAQVWHFINGGRLDVTTLYKPHSGKDLTVDIRRVRLGSNAKKPRTG